PPLTGEVTFTWYRDGELIVGATEQSLVIPGVTFDDAGVYHVGISDGNGVVYVSDPFTLHVLSEGSLPAVGFLALCILAVTLLLVGSVRQYDS
ncbi:MAG TPA: immunoglobulin domain-containing protein, partial [Candidatus Hydrogenedentes bacterium]|nr:immunoglobulin domain-containing protein [Candidatus Hydrogenedentota bacterium]